MNNSSHTGLYQSANSSTSTLRPRAARLISYLDDDTADTTAISTSSASTPPRFPSRGVSPSLSTKRSKSPDKSQNVPTVKPSNATPSGLQSPSMGSQGLWDSWSSIQGIASSLLGSDTSTSGKDKSRSSFKTPVWMKQDKTYSTRNSTLQWGPASESPPSAQGSIEERKARIELKKREALLLAAVAESQDSSGRFKRRDSDTEQTTSIPDDSNQDALVYMHKVQKGDTLPGVIIKYNCQAEAFRKLNRFWPNDNIQTRTHVLVPVDACSARGRKVDSPYLSQDLFDSQLANADTPVPGSTQPRHNGVPSINGIHPTLNSNLAISSILTSEPLTQVASISEDIEFRHDSWVMLPSFRDAVEVLRVPRRALGYFPRTRRKSNATLSGISTNSTPRTSFDMLRHPPTHAAQTSASLVTSPVRRPGHPNSLSSNRQRSSSVTVPGSSFADALRGPGGVGTLSGLRTELSRPGPAEDPLNKNFAQYLPDLLPPEEMPRTGFSLRPSARATPRASTDSARSTRSNSANMSDVGVAIEGWVRKMAGAKSLRDRNGTTPKMGDLIELETNSEISGPDIGPRTDSSLDTNIDQARQSDDTMTPKTMHPSSAESTSTSTATEQALLNERFPMRGRVRNAYETGQS
ncbi:uncharacterized protein A1O9_04585 [Exophiala aquamarina CBS 119918]|uniref:LysM domain-containing protein n=1 Tax=Exophiala aquamarina CBS 119918 TaxID=1182545 RepID=A0A072PI13_9EURO|nr:uncharacterized protein A1O9_04585 [Exophiala aquamarina CBS 119918]KEF59739.1 hypothetical protein A1O9_04585 [Exophiala aquamarina CBS 119918]